MAYRVHSITVRKEDQFKADEIINEHWDLGELDDARYEVHWNSDGTSTVTYWLNPYVYEDFEAIKKEFQEAGIVLR